MGEGDSSASLPFILIQTVSQFEGTTVWWLLVFGHREDATESECYQHESPMVSQILCSCVCLLSVLSLSKGDSQSPKDDRSFHTRHTHYQIPSESSESLSVLCTSWDKLPLSVLLPDLQFRKWCLFYGKVVPRLSSVLVFHAVLGNEPQPLGWETSALPPYCISFPVYTFFLFPCLYFWENVSCSQYWPGYSLCSVGWPWFQKIVLPPALGLQGCMATPFMQHWEWLTPKAFCRGGKCSSELPVCPSQMLGWQVYAAIPCCSGY